MQPSLPSPRAAAAWPEGLQYSPWGDCPRVTFSSFGRCEGRALEGSFQPGLEPEGPRGCFCFSSCCATPSPSPSSSSSPGEAGTWGEGSPELEEQTPRTCLAQRSGGHCGWEGPGQQIGSPLPLQHHLDKQADGRCQGDKGPSVQRGRPCSLTGAP